MSEVSLKEHLERLLSEQDRRIQQAHDHSQEAIRKAEFAIDKRLDLLNEFRAQSADESATYARIDHINILKERLANLESAKDRMMGAILLLAMIGVANLVKLFW